MKFELQKSEIQKIALEHSYTANNIEKVIRLSFILNDLNAHTEFNGKLLLKGGHCHQFARLCRTAQAVG